MNIYRVLVAGAGTTSQKCCYIDTVLGSPVFLSSVPDPAPRARPPAIVSVYSNSRQSSRLQLSGFQSFRSCVNLVLPNTEHRTQLLRRLHTSSNIDGHSQLRYLISFMGLYAKHLLDLKVKIRDLQSVD